MGGCRQIRRRQPSIQAEYEHISLGWMCRTTFVVWGRYRCCTLNSAQRVSKGITLQAIEHTERAPFGDGLCTACDAELTVDIARVHLDGVQREVESRSDVLIA